MTKNFYIVVPYSLMEERTTTRKKLKKVIISDLSKQDLQRCKDQLWQRMEFVAIGLRRCDLSTTPLTTPELIELLWSWNHPKEAEVGYYPEILPELIK